MRNPFDLSHEHKTTCDLGELIPVLCEEVLPGDTMIHNASALCRVAPLAHPIMHDVQLRMHTFYVPNRILWIGWEDFITGTNDVASKPTISVTGPVDRLIDHLGIPPVAGLSVDAMPVFAYNMIWNQFFRDQDLQTERGQFDKSIAHCAWGKDYFTVARPQPQQGDAAPIPLSGVGRLAYTADPAAAPNTDLQLLYDSGNYYSSDGTISDGMQVSLDEGNISIDDLRQTIALQRFAEARMRFGERYVDYLRYIGVNPSDGRLDRPEYIGGGKENLSFSEVLATATTTESEVGEMYGHGIGMGRSNNWRKQFEEHGWLITLLSARPRGVYQNVVPRKFTRETAMDYWQKELEVLPWQEVKESEVFAGASAENVWGYVPKFEEYRHSSSIVSGSLRGGTENDWTLAREFSSLPALNGSFIQCDPTSRIYQDANMPDLIINVKHNLKARRFVGQTASMGQNL